MKQICFLVLLLSAYISSFALTITYNVKQNSWRWRNNDGSETAAIWKAEQDTAIIYNSIQEVVRLRIEIVNASTRTSCLMGSCSTSPYMMTIYDSLQFSTTPTDSLSWKNIGLNANLPFVMANSDNFVVQDQTTTSQLTGSSYAFSPGKIMVSDSVLENISIPGNSRSEFEWTIIGTSNIVPNTTYYFRQFRRVSPSVSTQYLTPYPSLTTSSTLPIKLSSFTANNEGKKVKIEWSTATEENNDYFNLQRSTDGRTWATIDKIKGKGNSSVTNNYAAYDYGPPLSGIIYYRLQQFDLDGKYSFSDVKFIKMFGTAKPIVSVLPNPAKSGINFKLQNQGAASVEAILSDVSGRIIHEQIFKDVQPNVINKLNLKQQPTSGIYILKLKGDGFSESIKVVVQ